MQSPRINYLSWGRMEVEGLGRGKDFKLWPGGGRTWDWTETNTHHRPGIQPADVEELIEHDVSTVILSRGHLRRLRTPRATLEFLEQNRVECEVRETRAAVVRYNELAEEGVQVGGLFHSTC